MWCWWAEVQSSQVLLGSCKFLNLNISIVKDLMYYLIQVEFFSTATSRLNKEQPC